METFSRDNSRTRFLLVLPNEAATGQQCRRGKADQGREVRVENAVQTPEQREACKLENFYICLLVMKGVAGEWTQELRDDWWFGVGDQPHKIRIRPGKTGLE